MSKKIKLSKFKQDDKNFNTHTEKGMELLGKSIEKAGVIESITVSSDDKVISGNARQTKMQEIFQDVEPIVVETDGTRPVILKRTDISSGTKEFHEAALLANTVAKHNINLDTDLIQEIAVEEYGIDVEELGVEVLGFDENSDEDFSNSSENPYTKKVEAPIYNPSEKKPQFSDVYDKTKFEELISEIENSTLDKEQKEFLKLTATRHIVFNYEKIADLYAHSDKQMQELMENSALVIIDFDKAIEKGFVKLSDEIAEQYQKEYRDEE